MAEFEKEADEMMAKERLAAAAAPDAGSSRDRPTHRHVGKGPPKVSVSDDTWRAAENVELGSVKIEAGDEVDHPALSKIVGDKGICEVEEGQGIFCIRTSLSKGEFVKTLGSAAQGSDARILPISLKGEKRMRNWRDAVEARTEENFEDFPLAGP
eukprot:9063534-Karenia_brevis.AAC.1